MASPTLRRTSRRWVFGVFERELGGQATRSDSELVDERLDDLAHIIRLRERGDVICVGDEMRLDIEPRRKLECGGVQATCVGRFIPSAASFRLPLSRSRAGRLLIYRADWGLGAVTSRSSFAFNESPNRATQRR